ncbi:MAG: PAS domain-containing protein [Synechococcaceae cyanobacterium RL_1_2]|nr:PAS domain-containing protein [Synechococcaceae cyanobacterium RL_1_2]
MGSGVHYARISFFADLEAARNQTLALCILALIGSLIFVIFTSKRLTRSLCRITQATQNLASNQYTADIPATFIKEIQLLNDTWTTVAKNHQQAHQLRKHYTQQLEQEVAKKTEDLRQSQHDLKDIFRSVPAAITRMQVLPDRSWQILHVSHACKAISGYSPQELIDHQGLWIERILPEDWAKIAPSIFEDIFNGKSNTYEYRLRDKNNHIHWISQTNHSYWDQDSNCWCVTLASLDISDRKQIELELRQTTTELNSFFKLALDLFCIVDLDGCFLRLNDQWHKTLGYSLEELEKTQFLKYVHPDDQELTKLAFADLRQHHVLNNFTNRYICRDLSVRWIEWQAIVHEGMVYAAARDISDHKQFEQELLTSMEAAKAAAIAKGLFLATMSHEIRTPMNGVLGMLHLLQKTQLNGEQRSNITIAQSNAESLLNLINDILDLSKIEAGKLEIDQADFNLHQEVKGFINVMAPMATEKGLDLNLILEPIIPVTVKGDPGRLRQIFTNLIGNAIKFTSQGKITIQTRLQEYRDGWLLISSVTDTGIGIAQDKLKELFEPFTQADSSTTRQYGGTGLGLAITKQLCELMGGSIYCHSEPGQGSHFEFTVLLAKSDGAHYPSQPKSKYQPISLMNHPHPARILVVDDMPINQLVLKGLMDCHRFTLDEATNGNEALAKLRTSSEEQPYDLIFMDCLMPGLDGYETTHHIRQGLAGDRYSNVPIIAMTANTVKGGRQKCLAAGMNDYLSKPIVPDHLGKMLQQWFLSPTPQPITIPTVPTIAQPLETNWSSFSPQTMLGYVNNDPSLAICLIEDFLTYTYPQLQQLNTMVAEQNLYTIEHQLHKGKSVVAILAGHQLLPILQTMEEAAKNQDMQTLIHHLDPLDQELNRLEGELTQWLTAQNLVCS